MIGHPFIGLAGFLYALKGRCGEPFQSLIFIPPIR